MEHVFIVVIEDESDLKLSTVYVQAKLERAIEKEFEDTSIIYSVNQAIDFKREE